MINDPVLYHGTRYLGAILRSNTISLPPSGYPMVSLTRDPRVAAYWAQLPRDDDEGAGAVLVLSRTRLAHRYRIRPFRDEGCFDWQTRTFETDEAEEMIWGRPITNLRNFLLEIRHVPERQKIAA